MTLLQSQKTSRKLLIVLWFCPFIINVALILYLKLISWIESDTLFQAIKTISYIYSPYIGAITLFYWSKSRQSRQENADVNPTAIILALFCSFVWNGLIIALLLPIAFKGGDVIGSLENSRNISGVLSWLVSGAMGYYFANPNS